MVLITDVFPPKSGGSGWSTFYLGKALAERGHTVRVLRPAYDEPVFRPSIRTETYDGLHVERMLMPPAPRWAEKVGISSALQERTARRLLASRAYKLAMAGNADILHGQHKVSAGAASIAAQKARTHGARVASVATVRDYWPLCPVSTRLFTMRNGSGFECRNCHRFLPYLRAVTRSSGLASLQMALAPLRWLSTLASIRLLARCDSTIAVSRYVRDELAMSGRLDGTKLYSIPNLVHLPSVERALATEWPLNDISLHDSFALFVGKFEPNKGVDLLARALKQACVTLPVVLAGDGPLRAQLAREAAALGLDFRFYDWLDNDPILRLMQAARVLLFPSAWQEPLSRVLLEGCAAGAAILALNTGGTADIIAHGESGWLAADQAEFAEGVRRVVEDDTLNLRIRAGARRRAETVFSAPVVSAEIEALYASVLEDLPGDAT